MDSGILYCSSWQCGYVQLRSCFGHIGHVTRNKDFSTPKVLVDTSIPCHAHVWTILWHLSSLSLRRWRASEWNRYPDRCAQTLAHRSTHVAWCFCLHQRFECGQLSTGHRSVSSCRFKLRLSGCSASGVVNQGWSNCVP